jgi:hypothetical protein
VGEAEEKNPCWAVTLLTFRKNVPSSVIEVTPPLCTSNLHFPVGPFCCVCPASPHPRATNRNSTDSLLVDPSLL